MARKLDGLPQQERDKIHTDLLALSVIYNERYGHASGLKNAEASVPAHLLNYFHQRLLYYRNA
ncbi:DNA polymerase III subunit theta [Serratia oryzae]|jgi:DNA polymerase-3 subunit theta|uniref:DNA polymerase II n=1 Tax=Serratia oryzae TaxID=2034155 RepID=A0A1S8CL31_9GAMM|nr:DNA polymerase III subunit theta [Serratia oryzae]OMQ24562.1 DNA polymerase II [Serratia oryzae]VXC90290.1 DNA polymerase II [Enterobacterales bacterium 8AC]